MADIFISYARADRDRIEKLAAALEGEGFTVWWDRHIAGGSEFSKDIERELDAAKVAIVAWSKESVESRWVKDEAGLAAEAGKLVTISLDGEAPPIGFKQFHAIDFSSGAATAIDDLKKTLAIKMDGHAPSPLPKPAASTQKLSGPKTLGGAVAVVALLAIAAFFFLRGAHDPRNETAPSLAAAGPEQTATAPSVQEKSVAVLPFVALSPGADDGYFADGLTEEILNSLAALPDLLVTARTSSFYFKDKDIPMNEIAETLGVAHVVEGSVRRGGDTVRVTAQLIRASDGFHLWSQTYDRPLNNVLSIQTEIAESIADALSIYLDKDQRAAIGRTGTSNVEAFEAFLAGEEIARKAHALEPGYSLWDANVEFERAMALDPKYVAPAMSHHDAYAHYLLDGPNNLYLTVTTKNRPELTEEKARAGLLADLDRAINNARTPTARVVAEITKDYFSSDWSRMPGRLKWFRENGDVEEASSYDVWLSHILLLFGDFETLKRMSDFEIRTNPLHPGVWSGRLVEYAAQGELDAAEETLRRGRETAGDHRWLQLDELLLAIEQKDKEKVLALLRASMREKTIAEKDRNWRKAYLAAVEGDDARAIEIAGDIESDWPQDYLLLVYHELGDRERSRALTQQIDSRVAGPTILARLIVLSHNRIFFDPADAPNFMARLKEARIDVDDFQPMPRFSSEEGTDE